MKTFTDEYQTLIGGASGVIFSMLGFYFKSVYDRYNKRKDNLRRIEIGITRSLDDIYKIDHKLGSFIKSIEDLVKSIEGINNKKHFSIDAVSFPAIREVYRDVEMPNYEVKSFYLHNLLLWSDAGIREYNQIIISLRNGFDDLKRKNELLVNLLSQQRLEDASNQREQYVYNLNSFADTIKDIISNNKELKKIMIRAKIYNNKTRVGIGGKLFAWRCEGVSFKYFNSYKDYKEFSRTLDSIDRIDLLIGKEVDSFIKEVEERALKSNNN